MSPSSTMRSPSIPNRSYSLLADSNMPAQYSPYVTLPAPLQAKGKYTTTTTKLPNK